MHSSLPLINPYADTSHRPAVFKWTPLLIARNSCSESFVSRSHRARFSSKDALWHHLWFTWKRSAGALHQFDDGERKFGETGLKKGYRVPSRGAIVLGQEQEEWQGGFVRRQAFVGNLTRVNLWSYVKSPAEMSRMFRQSCIAEEGNSTIKWKEFIPGIVRECQGDYFVLSWTYPLGPYVWPWLLTIPFVIWWRIHRDKSPAVCAGKATDKPGNQKFATPTIKGMDQVAQIWGFKHYPPPPPLPTTHTHTPPLPSAPPPARPLRDHIRDCC